MHSALCTVALRLLLRLEIVEDARQALLLHVALLQHPLDIHRRQTSLAPLGHQLLNLGENRVDLSLELVQLAQLLGKAGAQLPLLAQLLGISVRTCSSGSKNIWSPVLR